MLDTIFSVSVVRAPISYSGRSLNHCWEAHGGEERQMVLMKRQAGRLA